MKETRIFKTPKGTELPLVDLKGKEYLQVQHRIRWFVEEKPEWVITTRLVERTDSWILFEASIIDDKGKIRSSAHKFGALAMNLVEKAETGAVGRALAFLGYGTQFTGDELDEGDHLADSPSAPMKPQSVEKLAAASAPVMPQTSSPQEKRTKELSEKQIKRLWAIAKTHGWSNSDVMSLIRSKFKIGDADVLTKKEYDYVCNYMESAPPPQQDEIPF